MVTRRIDQVKTLCAKEWIAEDYKTFLNASVQALQLILDSMDSNDTQIGDLFEPYSYIVNLLNDSNNVTRTFYDSIIKSSELLTETMNANDDQYGDLFESYSHIVQLITDVSNVMKFYNNDYLTINSSSNFTRDELEAMMEAYIGDIEMVRKCEVSLGRSVRVNLRIVETIKSLSKGMQRYEFFNDDESISFSRKS
uniref:Uncharacterized protein n=1 Tax=Tetranychus urticae TaxID=32264 RepID=T1KB71_TETUR